MLKLAVQKKIEQNFKLSKVSIDLIPYACHFDEQTILTKNGELMQTIKIAGFSKELVGQEVDLRGIIRKSLIDNVKSNKFSFWIHTIRRKVNLDSPSVYDYTFAKDTHETWCEKNHWRDKFVNELYITIIQAGEKFDSKEPNLFNLFSTKYLKTKHEKKLEQSRNELETIVCNMLATLKLYGAKRLKIVYDNIGAKSEILEFIAKIIHLSEKRMEIPIMDLASYFASSKMAFGDKSFQLTEDNNKSFGAILSIKDYQDLSPELIDSLLRLSQHFIITQTINFIDASEAKKEFTYANYILDVSKDEWLKEKSGLKKILESDQGNETDYGKSQLTIMISGNDKDDLEFHIENSVKKLRSLGLVAVREDLNMENCFWSQLPGNFNFIKRNQVINTSKIAGFASLYNSPKGQINNVWGSAITLFRLKDGTPYFFNFHQGEIGHTLICGPSGSGKATLMNFVLCEASKFKPRILFVDQFKTSKILMKSIGGLCGDIKISTGKKDFSFNPLLLSDSEINRNFLKSWFRQILFPLDYSVSNDESAKIDEIIDKLYQIDKAKRQLQFAEEFVSDKGLLKNLVDWRLTGKYAAIFDNQKDDFDYQNKVMNYCFADIMEQGDNLIVPVVSYLIHRFNISLDGSPAIFLLNDAFQILKSPIFKSQLEIWLDYLSSMNAIVIFMQDSKDIKDSSINSIIPNKFATLLMPSDQKAPDSYKDSLKLTEQELEVVRKMNVLNRHFMIKKDDEYLVAELNLDGLDYALAVLSGKDKYIKMMEEAILETEDNPNKWLLPFYLKVEADLEQQNKKLF